MISRYLVFLKHFKSFWLFPPISNENQDKFSILILFSLVQPVLSLINYLTDSLIYVLFSVTFLQKIWHTTDEISFSIKQFIFVSYMVLMKLQAKLFKTLITVTFKVFCPNRKLSLNDTTKYNLVSGCKYVDRTMPVC